MRMTARFVGVIAAAVIFAAAVDAAGKSEDFKAFQKAAKANPAYERGREVKWFKVEVTDARTHKTKVKITLPIALVDVALKCVEETRVRLDDSDCGIDLKALCAELKKAGPMALIEVREDGEIVRIWFE